MNGVDDEKSLKGTRPELVLKALRLHVENQIMFGEDNSHLKGIDDWQWKIENLSMFRVALNIKRATQRDDVIAKKFYEELVRRGTVHPVKKLRKTGQGMVILGAGDTGKRLDPELYEYVLKEIETLEEELDLSLAGFRKDKDALLGGSLTEVALEVNGQLKRPFEFTHPKFNTEISEPVDPHNFTDENAFYEHCMDLAENYYGSRRSLRENT